jgi:hypothetical protein
VDEDHPHGLLHFWDQHGGFSERTGVCVERH